MERRQRVISSDKEVTTAHSVDDHERLLQIVLPARVVVVIDIHALRFVIDPLRRDVQLCLIIK